MKATWNDTIIAESTDTVVVENNHYFPLTAVKAEYLKPSNTTTVCSWKGTAKQIRGRVAFWKGVTVTP